MPHKCPLCLKDLGQSEQLVRFCLTHRKTEQFNCSDNLAGMFCPERESQCNESLDSGVFLRHIGCEAKNPFWDSTKKEVELPGDDIPAYQDTSTVPHRVVLEQGSTPVEGFHWQIGMLRALPRDVEEMWFPLMLLRAATEVNQRQRVGVLVELTGANRVGKTVLAMQAMDSKGYVHNDNDGRGLILKDYIYSRRGVGSDIPLLDMLYLRDIMERNHAFNPTVLGTKIGPGDLKAVFIEPSKNSEISTMYNRVGIIEKVRDFRRDIWRDIKELSGFSSPSGTTSSHHPFWYTVMFYDTAGELSRRGSQILKRIEEAVSKTAVLVNAVELFDKALDTSEAESSISVARRRLGDLRGKRNLEVCLVVTQVDLVMDQLSPEDRQSVYQIAQALDKNPADDKEARELLIKWVRKNPQQNVKSIKRLLKGVKVFFVWTEGIPTDESKFKGARTYSFGLARFICWCLGVQWRDITHVESPELEEH